MNKIVQQVFLIITLCFLAGVALLGYHLYKRQKRNFDSTTTYEQMLNAHMRQFNTEGKLKEELKADSWANRQNETFSVLDNPYMTIIKDDGKKWHITSKEATLISHTTGGSVGEVILENNVHINRPQTETSNNVDLYTEQLHYFPDSSEIESNKKVELRQPGLIIQGKGLTGNLESQHVKILENVTTEYSQTTQ